MAIEFNCEEFAEYAHNEAKKYLSDTLTDEAKEFVLTHFKDCTLRSTRVLSLDEALGLDKDEVVSVAHIILEWIFKVSVALVESEIPSEYRHGIILDIGFTAFDITKDICKIPDITDNQMFSTGEYHVINKLKEILEKLVAEASITESERGSLLKHRYITQSEQRIEFELSR